MRLVHKPAEGVTLGLVDAFSCMTAAYAQPGKVKLVFALYYGLCCSL